MKKLLLLLLMACGANAQTVYLNTNQNKIYRANPDNSITLIVTTDILLNDIAIDTNGNFYGISNTARIVSINMQTGVTAVLATLPGPPSSGAKSLVCNYLNELFVVDNDNQSKLYKYSIANNQLEVVATLEMTPGDLTFYKGNLIFPGPTFGNEAWIKAYDFQTQTIKTIFCGSPLGTNFWFYGITNRYTSCGENEIIGWQELVYIYDIENAMVTPSGLSPVINANIMMVNGLASDNEYMASNPDCYVNLEGIDCALGMAENAFEASLEIFPNPTRGTFSIQSKNEITSFEILDVNGRSIQKLDPKSQTVDISNLQNGLYLVKVTANHQTMFKKLVKN